MKHLPLLAVTLFMLACQSLPKTNIFDGVGLWKEISPISEAVTLRNADGTMECKEIRRFDYSDSGEYSESEWQWSIRGDNYRITMLKTSAEMWQKDIGKTWNLKVLSLDEDVFRYLSSDGAMVEEKRIGSASNAVYNKVRLKGLQLSHAKRSDQL